MGAIGAMGAIGVAAGCVGAEVRRASCGAFDAGSGSAVDCCDWSRRALRVERFRAARAIGLEDVVVRAGDEARPAAAAALDPESGRRETGHNEDQAIRTRTSFLQHEIEYNDDRASQLLVYRLENVRRTGRFRQRRVRMPAGTSRRSRSGRHPAGEESGDRSTHAACGARAARRP